MRPKSFVHPPNVQDIRAVSVPGREVSISFFFFISVPNTKQVVTERTYYVQLTYVDFIFRF